MILERLFVSPDEFSAGTGWELRPRGACCGDACVPVGDAGRPGDDGTIAVEAIAERLGMPLVHDEDAGVWALGPAILGQSATALVSANAPDLRLPTLDGQMFDLASLRGQKVLLVVWAPYCGCAADQPHWQRLRAELHPQGLEVVTIGMDAAGPEACRPYIEAAAPEHPTLIDETHKMASLFGVDNIPNGIWIDEDGVIVRPAGVAFPEQVDMLDESPEMELPTRMMDIFAEAARIDLQRAEYVPAVRDWVRHGPDSRFALSPEQVIAQSIPRGADEALAAAHFDLAQHLWRHDRLELAREHFKEAHRLQPDNIAYKRQAWSLEPSVEGRWARFWQGPVEGRESEWPYPTDWLSEVRERGPQSYYRPSDLS